VVPVAPEPEQLGDDEGPGRLAVLVEHGHRHLVLHEAHHLVLGRLRPIAEAEVDRERGRESI